ncbi:MAG: cyclase family protein [Methanocorpusculum sp.]|uniref:cyclase family protein n=1 Tax=Methanocorpusculum sp. TaxID=2058474 RepID=UPI00271A5A7E|nr:cyclase family protein [Methanocorpusculum sp.]MDO9523662.1 cyclase family protein [Methanocorpusculum sp.]
MKIYDVSVGLHPGMYIYPGDPEFLLTPLKAGNAYISSMFLGTHTGTHIDAPAHYFPNEKTIDRIGLDNLIIPVEVVTSPLLPTQNCKAVFFKNAAPLSMEMAEVLLLKGFKTVGCDTPSIGDDDVHRFLLKNEIVIIEMLDLSKISDGVYQMIALPLKIEGADASPARVILLDDML